VFPHSPESLRGTFGYHPDPNDFAELIERAEAGRILVINGPLNAEWTAHQDFRVLHDDDTGLAAGAYWFLGHDQPMVAVVHTGVPGADGTLVPLADLTEESPLAAALGWAEHHWANAAEIPAPKFAVDSIAVSATHGTDAFIRQRRYVGGAWTYSVRLDGRPQQVRESALVAPPPDGDAASWVYETPAPVARFGATLTRGKLERAFTNTVFSFRATRTTFRPYQFKPVLKLLQTGGTRILIADEVGLGKTIEAGLIWTELEARRKADRVLVVCPSSLLDKWRAEMEMRFGFILTELNSDGLREFLVRHREGRLPRRLAYVASLEGLRRWSGLADLEENPPQFDLVIVDEAHSMRNPATKSHALGEQLADWTLARVFLTATPINLGEQDLHSLLELLSPEDYGGSDDLMLRLEPNGVLHRLSETLFDKSVRAADRLGILDTLGKSTYGAAVVQRPEVELLRTVLREDPLSPAGISEARRHLAELNTLSAVITRTRKVEVDDQKALRSAHSREISWTHLEQRFYDEYLVWCSRRAAQVKMPVSFAMQMPLRLASACLPAARASVLAGESVIIDEDQRISSVSRSWVEPHSELIAAARALPTHVDTKFDALLEVVQQFVEQRRRSLLFTFSLPTLAYLERRLAPHARVAVLNGRVPRRKRAQIMADFREGAYDIVLANRVASEGLDFEFCSAVINYDLPWNPMEIEQRIGRIDRIGQLEKKVLIANFINLATIDERILSRVLERIQIFERSIGPLEPIIQSQLKALQSAFDFTLTEEERNQKADEVLAAIETKAAGVAEISDASASLLVSNDVDIDGLERDLLETGRYVGQQELALLLDDWARTEGGSPVRFAADGKSMELRGTPAMADRVMEIARDGARTQKEVEDRADALRAELAITLLLDQERARVTGGDLLTATDPLVLAAASVPGNHLARFGHVKVTASDPVPTGIYTCVLAVATTVGPRPGQEIWGEVVTLEGQAAPRSVAEAVLAALARGELQQGSERDPSELSRLAERANDQLLTRQAVEEERQQAEARAVMAARRTALDDQLRRHLAAIDRRLRTSIERGRSEGSRRLFIAQKARARDRHQETLRVLEKNSNVNVSLAPLAVCTVEVIRG